jgi:Flp pilus assembly secretin CpaC
LTIDIVRLAQVRHDAFGQHARLMRAGEPHLQDREFVAAKAGGHVVAAQARAQTTRHRLQKLVAATIFGAFVPGLLTRKNETTVEIPSGGSIASAGLLQTQSRQVINGTPGLIDLPVLGALFRSNDYQKQETELMIIVTPYIVKPTKSDEIARPTDGFADASDPQAWLLGRVNQLYASPGNPEAIKDYKGPVGFIQD